MNDLIVQVRDPFLHKIIDSFSLLQLLQDPLGLLISHRTFGIIQS